MIIEKIQKNKLYLSNQEIMEVTPLIRQKYNLKVNSDIKSLYDEISYEASLAKALYYLSLRDRTEEELRIKLGGKFRNASSIDRAVKKVREMGYINDHDYALSYIKNSRFGEKRAEFELMKRGISKKIISEVLALGEGVSDYDKLKKAIKKVMHKTDKQIIQYLIRQGFELEDILYVLRHAKEER